MTHGMPHHADRPDAAPFTRPATGATFSAMSRTREDAERAAEAALRPVAGVEELQVVGAVHDRVLDQLGILTSARSVWLHPDVVHRIERQRASGSRDAEFVLTHMARTILRPAWAGLEQRPSRRAGVLRLVSTPASTFAGTAARTLCVALKLVTGPRSLSGLDEIWVSAAFPLGAESLTRLQRRGRLSGVEWGADD